MFRMRYGIPNAYILEAFGFPKYIVVYFYMCYTLWDGKHYILIRKENDRLKDGETKLSILGIKN